MSKLASKDSSRDIAESETDKEVKANVDAKPIEPPPILKYLKTHVIKSSIFTIPFISMVFL